MKNLIIRVDTSPQIGIGHVMRCLALAQAWQDGGGESIFAMAKSTPTIEARLKSEGMEIYPLAVSLGSDEDASQAVGVALEREASWVVVDGYHFGAHYQKIVKNSKRGLLFIDDYGNAEHYCADLVLNQNLHAHESLYSNREPYTQLLLGTRYVLLRREFLKWLGWKREIPEVAHKVLVTLGGGDPNNVTLKVIQALQQVEIDGLEAVVVVGGSNPHYETLTSAVRDSQVPIHLQREVTDMPELMAWADVAISAGGSTCWELAFMGVPSLVLVLAENQHPVAAELDSAKVATSLGWHENLSPGQIARAVTQLSRAAKRRSEMSQLGPRLIDGEGAERVATRIEGKKLRLRPVRDNDCELLWEWANELGVRAASFSSKPIPQAEHVKWFKRKLQDPNCCIFIGLDEHDKPVGQVRFDRWRDDGVEIHVSIDPSRRGAGYGSLLISLALEKMTRTRAVGVVHAFIKPDNKSSIGAFEKAGFKRLGLEKKKGAQALHYVWAQG